MDPHLTEEDGHVIQQYTATFITLAHLDSHDNELFLYPVNKLTAEHGEVIAFSVFSALALVGMGRLDWLNMLVDPEPIEVQTKIVNPELGITTPGELPPGHGNAGILAASEFMLHIAANDTKRAFETINTLYVNSQICHDEVNDDTLCGCQIMRFVATLAKTAMMGPMYHDDDTSPN